MGSESVPSIHRRTECDGYPKLLFSVCHPELVEGSVPSLLKPRKAELILRQAQDDGAFMRRIFEEISFRMKAVLLFPFSPLPHHW
jgi:hypothetical protein